MAMIGSSYGVQTVNDDIVFYYQELLAEARATIEQQRNLIEKQAREITDLKRIVEDSGLNILTARQDQDEAPLPGSSEFAFYHSKFGTGMRGLVAQRCKSPRGNEQTRSIELDCNPISKVAPPPAGPPTPSQAGINQNSNPIASTIQKPKSFDFSPAAKFSNQPQSASAGCAVELPFQSEASDTYSYVRSEYQGIELCRTDSEASTSFSSVSARSNISTPSTPHSVASLASCNSQPIPLNASIMMPLSRSTTPKSVAARRQGVTRLRSSTTDRSMEASQASASREFPFSRSNSSNSQWNTSDNGFDPNAEVKDGPRTPSAEKATSFRRPPALVISNSATTQENANCFVVQASEGVLCSSTLSCDMTLSIAHDNPQLGSSVAEMSKSSAVYVLLECKEDRSNEMIFILGKCIFSGAQTSQSGTVRGSQFIVINELSAVKGAIGVFPTRPKNGIPSNDSECIKELQLCLGIGTNYEHVQAAIRPKVIPLLNTQDMYALLAECSSRVDVILKPICNVDSQGDWYPYFEGARKMAPQFRSNAVGYLRLGNDMSMFGTSFLSSDSGLTFIGNDDSLVVRAVDAQKINKAASIRAARLSKKLNSGKVK